MRTLERYTSLDRKQLEPFGPYEKHHAWDFDWYFNARGDVGITGNPTTEAESFLAGLLVRPDRLIVDEERNLIRRESDQCAKIIGDRRDTSGAAMQTQRLISLLKAYDPVHVYVAEARNESEKRKDDIIVFSARPPNAQLYAQQSAMPIVFK